MLCQNKFVASRKQSMQFGAWPAGSNPTALNALVDAIETKLETPPPALPVVSESQRLEQYPAEVRPRIQEIQGHLKKVEPNNGYGMALALDVLNLQAETGYQLTPQETDKFNILVNKSAYDLESALRYFPKKNEWDRSAGAYTQEGLERFLNVWLASQNSYLPVKNMMAKAGASSQFQMTPTMEAAFSQRLESLKEALNNPEVQAAQLKQLGNSFRPKFKLVEDLQKIFKVLTPAEGLFAQQVQQDVEQAIALIAERNAKVIFAGKLVNGNIYVFTQSTQSYKERFFIGPPGDLQEVKMVQGSRAMDGSDTTYQLENQQEYRFQRQSFSINDVSKWRATMNEELIPVEFPAFS
jgi:hypothetical protein